MKIKLLLLFLLLFNLIMLNFFDNVFAKLNLFLRYLIIKLNAINFSIQRIYFTLNFFIIIK